VPSTVKQPTDSHTNVDPKTKSTACPATFKQCDSRIFEKCFRIVRSVCEREGNFFFIIFTRKRFMTFFVCLSLTHFSIHKINKYDFFCSHHLHLWQSAWLFTIITFLHKTSSLAMNGIKPTTTWNDFDQKMLLFILNNKKVIFWTKILQKLQKLLPQISLKRRQTMKSKFYSLWHFKKSFVVH
jgi:hypothetical protein